MPAEINLPLSEHTIGPFYPQEFFRPGDNDLTKVSAEARATAEGQALLLRGCVTREGGVPVVNAILEAWQPDARGRFRHPHDPQWQSADPDFLGWGRAWTDDNGMYEFRTIMPGGYVDRAMQRAPHINLSIWGAGLMRRVQTTVFFPEFHAENLRDPVFLAVPEDLRGRLVLRLEESQRGEVPLYLFDIRLRGARGVETPFFED
jgi:protocatechuate 3,4-dioxygenase alpha subunit